MKQKKLTKTMKNVTLETLVGKRVLSGVDFDKEEVKTWGDEFEIAQVIRFVLDGVIFAAVEDPEDGYRSTMREIFITEKPCENTFSPVEVAAKMKLIDEYGQKSSVLQLFHAKTDALILEVGTENTDDYYPWYVAHFDELALKD